MCSFQMSSEEVKELLKNTKYEHFISFINKRYDFEYSLNRPLFKIECKEGIFALKIREKSDIAVFNLEKIITKIKDDDNFLHKYSDIILKDDYLIMVSDWLINGKQSIENNREDLPKYFSFLARFNKQNPANSCFTSMYTSFIIEMSEKSPYNNHFDNIKDLLKYETDHHLKDLHNIIETKEIIEILKILENGLPCIILEDINAGNFIRTNDGKYKFLDVEYMYNGLNLYQFDKILYFNFKKEDIDKILIKEKEAKECYTAYFDTLGIKHDEANEQIRAIELLKVLRKNSKFNVSRINNEETVRRINIVKDIDKFI